MRLRFCLYTRVASDSGSGRLCVCHIYCLLGRGRNCVVGTSVLPPLLAVYGNHYLLPVLRPVCAVCFGLHTTSQAQVIGCADQTPILWHNRVWRSDYLS